MTKTQCIVTLFLANALIGAGYTANPATKEYVDQKVQELQSRIAAIPAGPPGPPGPQGEPGGVLGVGAPIAVGDQAMGGVVFWVDDTGQHGLIAAVADNNNAAGVNWRNTVNKLTGTAGSDGIFAGIKNNAQIMAIQIPDGNNNFAAKVCANYRVQDDGVTPCPAPGAVGATAGDTCYADWYLPSIFELKQLFLQRGTVGGFDAVVYWSSTEVDSDNAYSASFALAQATPNARGKGNSLRVRCIRPF
ncbi:DUF1566 domain-containing protein [Legionella nagasakiensis]|uniref:DUF1566 domain-containing protein n=1 Tax=Legionella nagasakiensis TaxID=535290 RepID=UPI0010565663|nr:DUF1566 domain-containing protein [Legionella nagasakiensis]